MNLDHFPLFSRVSGPSSTPCCAPRAINRRPAWWAAGLLGVVCFGPMEPAQAQASAAAPVTLAWDANSETDLAGYRVRYGLSSGNHSQTLDVGKDTSVTLDGLTAKTTYFVVVTAYTTAGLESLPSEEISFSPLETPTLTFAMEPLPAPPPGDPALTASAATISDWTPLASGGFAFVITASPGQTLAVYASSDMLNWELLGTTTNPSGRLQATDHAAGSVNGRYYQVVPAQG